MPASYFLCRQVNFSLMLRMDLVVSQGKDHQISRVMEVCWRNIDICQISKELSLQSALDVLGSSLELTQANSYVTLGESLLLLSSFLTLYIYIYERTPVSVVTIVFLPHRSSVSLTPYGKTVGSGQLANV